MSMDNVKTVEGDLQCRELRFAILAARFNDFIVDQLIRGAVDALKRHGASEKQIDDRACAGAFDMPLVARKLAQSRKYDAIVALGAVIKGATAHFDYVAGECASGLARGLDGNRCADRIRRADDGHHRAGDRARRDQGGQ
jgi:6,7-dimethyl-8-ribityllumazine synthase